MMKQHLAKSIYIDALNLVPEKKSGVGYATEQTLKALIDSKLIASDTTIYLVVPLGKAKYLASYLAKNIKIKTIPIPARVFAVLLMTNLLLPVDWFLGRGIYVFPNFRNWPLWRSRSLTYIHDIAFKKFPDMVQPRNQKFLASHVKHWIDRSTKIVTVTNRVKDEIEKEFFVPEQKIYVIHNGVDGKTFYRRSSAEINKVKSKYGIQLNKYLLFVGNIEPRKNLLTLLDAYNNLPAELKKEYGLVVVGGDGWLNDEFYIRLNEINKNSKRIIKVAQYVETSDLPALYSGAAFLVHPAVYEGFGITPLEAMACETPVIVSDIPAIREVVSNFGIYFDPNSADSLTNAIVSGLNKTISVTKNISEGKKRAEEFSWTKSAKSLNELINREAKRGIEKSPIVLRLKYLYIGLDRMIRSLLGDKALKPYRPKEANNIVELRTVIYYDFLNELPSFGQELALKVYLRSKRILFLTIKNALSLRGR